PNAAAHCWASFSQARSDPGRAAGEGTRTDIGEKNGAWRPGRRRPDCKSIQPHRRKSCAPRPPVRLHFGLALPMTSHESGPVRPFVAAGPPVARRGPVRGASDARPANAPRRGHDVSGADTGSAALSDPDLLLPRAAAPSAKVLPDLDLGAAAAAGRARAMTPGETRFSRQFTAEWLALLVGLAVLGALIAWSLFKAHDALDATERDRLRVQARVVDDNVGQQLDGMYRALASVRGEFLATPVHSVSTLLSMRLKALSDAIPGVRSMVLLDPDGTVVASSVGTLLGRDFSDREYFRKARAGHDPDTLYVAPPLKTVINSYTVVFVRAIYTQNGAFAGAVAAALEPEYFKVLMRSVLY